MPAFATGTNCCDLAVPWLRNHRQIIVLLHLTSNVALLEMLKGIANCRADGCVWLELYSENNYDFINPMSHGHVNSLAISHRSLRHLRLFCRSHRNDDFQDLTSAGEAKLAIGQELSKAFVVIGGYDALDLLTRTFNPALLQALSDIVQTRS